MNKVRLVPATVEIVYDEEQLDAENFKREFYHMSEADEDPIGQWLRTAKARGDMSESDPVLLNMMVELYRKIDRLEHILTNTAPSRIELHHKGTIEAIGFEHFQLNEEKLETGKLYYGRIDMPIHPKRDIAIYFEAITPSLAKVVRFHQKDEDDWAAYMTSRERLMIRQMKGH